MAQDHGNHPAVLQAAGFSTEHSAKARSIGYEEEVSPTLRAGVVPATMAIESNPTDGRVKTAREGVAQPEPVTLKIRSGCDGGGKGALWQENKSATLGTHNDQTLFQPAYGIAREAFNAGEKAGFNFAVNEEVSPTIQTHGPHAVAKPDSKTYDVRFTSEGTKNVRGHCYPTEISRCLDTGEANPDSNHGGVCVVEKSPACAPQGSMVGDRTEKNDPQGDGVNEDVSFTLTGAERHAVAPSGEHYSASKSSYFTSAALEQAGTLVATDWKDPPLVNDTPNDEPVYIVRRLTPVECARLQGFPDWWCEDLAIPDPTDEELSFWVDVWATWNKVNGKKPKNETQVRKWLADPYTDAAEYKLWGNGICLNNAFFVLAGIAWAAGKEAS